MKPSRWWSHFPKDAQGPILESIEIESLLLDPHDGGAKIFFTYQDHTHKFDPQIEIDLLEERKQELLETTRHLEGDYRARMDDTTYSGILDMVYPFAPEAITSDDRKEILEGIQQEIVEINRLIAEMTTVINRIASGPPSKDDRQIREVVLDRVFCDPFIREEDEVVLLLSDKPSLNGSRAKARPLPSWTGTKTEFAIKICEEYDANKNLYNGLADATRKLFVKHQFSDRNWTIAKCYDLVRQVCPQERERK